jgi:hypothetical protein
VALFLRRLFRSSRSEPAKKPRPAGSGPRLEGDMVRDRICNTFVPRSRALLLREGDKEHFFCSEACRKAHLESRKEAS